MTTLLACPFCGAELFNSGNFWCHPHHETCTLSQLEFPDEADQETAWNTRSTPLRDPGGDVEAVARRWRMGYPDGVPGTPEYEPAPRICNWCNSTESRCHCNARAALAALPSQTAGEGDGCPVCKRREEDAEREMAHYRATTCACTAAQRYVETCPKHGNSEAPSSLDKAE